MSKTEFDPKSERHFPLLTIKAIEPGCTTELQIEDAATGRIIRLTTTDDADKDGALFEREVLAAFRRAWNAYIIESD